MGGAGPLSRPERRMPGIAALCTLTDIETRRWWPMGGWLLWGLVLPVLLIVAGVITFRRRRGGR